MKMRLNKAAFEQFRKGESLDEIATRANIGQATLYRILRGKPFHSETVDSLAMALGCNSLDLLEVQRDEDELLGDLPEGQKNWPCHGVDTALSTGIQCD